jgi:hypothetical protein
MAYIKQAFIYEILKQYNRGEISFGRFCELINEEAKRDENSKRDIENKRDNRKVKKSCL